MDNNLNDDLSNQDIDKNSLGQQNIDNNKDFLDDLQVKPTNDLSNNRKTLDIEDELILKGTDTKNNLPKEFDAGLTNSSKSPSLWIWIVGGVFVIALLAITIYFVLTRISFNKGIIEFSFEPIGVDITIDSAFNKQNVDSLSIKLKSGDHIVHISKDGYLDFEREFYLASKEEAKMHIELKTIPEVEMVLDSSVSFMWLANNGKTPVYLKSDGSFGAVRLDLSLEDIKLFDGKFTNIQEVIWSSGEPKAIVKINGYPNLSNTLDNRDVVGRYIPLGESPNQGAAYRNGTSTWLFDDARQTSKGWQPVLLNESIREVTFSPDGRQIMYFYETADGEKSLVVANSDGVEWERMITQVNLNNPKLNWLNDEQYVLVFDDDSKDKLFDIISGDFIEIMPDRIKNTTIFGSPDGTKLLYLANVEGNNKLGVWDITSSERSYIFEEDIKAYVWKTDNEVIVAKEDNSLWYWSFYNNKLEPVQFISSLGDMSPKELVYSMVNKILYIIEDGRILSLQVN